MCASASGAAPSQQGRGLLVALLEQRLAALPPLRGQRGAPLALARLGVVHRALNAAPGPSAHAGPRTHAQPLQRRAAAGALAPLIEARTPGHGV